MLHRGGLQSEDLRHLQQAFAHILGHARELFHLPARDAQIVQIAVAQRMDLLKPVPTVEEGANSVQHGYSPWV